MTGHSTVKRIAVLAALVLSLVVIACSIFRSNAPDDDSALTGNIDVAEEAVSTPSEVPATPRARLLSLEEATSETGMDSSESSADDREDLPTRLEMLSADHGASDVLSRVAALSALGTLSGEEFEAIYRFLGSASNESGLSEGHWLWLKNDLLSFARHNDPDRVRHFNRLTALYRDRKGDPVIRDYTLQHLTALALGGEAQEGVIDLLREASSETAGTLAGTALLGHMRLVEARGEDADDLGPQALAIAMDPAYDSRSRLTALQVGAQSDPSTAAKIAASLLAEADTPAMERISAIGVLGRAGQNVDLLQQQAADSDSRVRRAARLALSSNSFAE